MANVLGELFQEIADAIRAKTGSTDKLAPAEFPDEILSIPTIVNGGGGTGTEGSLKIASGSFYVSDENIGRQTITHGLGQKPDFILVYSVGFNETEITERTVRLISAWGINSRFTDVPQKGAINAHGFYEADDGTKREFIYSALNEEYGMDKLPSSYRSDSNAWVYTPNDTTFEVGANSTYLFFPGISYYWIALSGVGASAQNAEDLSF